MANGNNNGKKFRFIDLFAGIGGIRIAFERVGGKCVFTSEWDEPCQVMYEANFGEKPFGDIKGVGKIYQQTAIDTHANVSLARIYSDKTALANVVRSRVRFTHGQGW